MRRALWAIVLIAAGIILPASASAQTVFADLNGDGARDRISASSHPVEVVVHLAGTARQRHLRAESPILRLAVADVDRDGHNDIVASTASSGLRVWLNRGHGRFKSHRTRAPGRHWHPASPWLGGSIPADEGGDFDQFSRSLLITAEREPRRPASACPLAQPRSRAPADPLACLQLVPRGPPLSLFS